MNDVRGYVFITLLCGCPGLMALDVLFYEELAGSGVVFAGVV